MQQLANTKIFVGGLMDWQSISSIEKWKEEWAVVHATQNVHYKIFGWDRTTNKPNQYHPNYIFYEKENRFSLNWVDGDAYLYDWSGPTVFKKALNFIDKWSKTRKILIHCDQGMSRSPTIALLYLAKRLKIISNFSFIEAKKDFLKLYFSYSPSGIADYVTKNWRSIN